MKSGWASAVLLVGSVSSIRVADSRRVELSDPAIPESQQPYHAGFGTAREAGQDLTRLVAAVKRFGRQSVTGLVRHYRDLTPELRGAGVVVGSLIDPARIANDHIRIHALEGQLFRGVVVETAHRCQLVCSIWRERDLYAAAAKTLKLPDQALRERVTALGRGVAGGWRAEQKNAALAAWIVLKSTPHKTGRPG